MFFSFFFKYSIGLDLSDVLFDLPGKQLISSHLRQVLNIQLAPPFETKLFTVNHSNFKRIRKKNRIFEHFPKTYSKDGP